VEYPRLSIAVGQGTRSPNIWTGGTLSREFRPHYLRSQVKSSCLYVLISWHFISPKRIFYFSVDKAASASGVLCPCILPGDFQPRPCYVPPNHGDRSTPMGIPRRIYTDTNPLHHWAVALVDRVGSPPLQTSMTLLTTSRFLVTKMSVCMSNISTMTACLKLIFTKFACSMKKELVRRASAYRHRKALLTTLVTSFISIFCTISTL